MAKTFVEKEQCTRLRLVNTRITPIEEGEFVILGDISGVALEDVPVGKIGAFHVEEGIVLQVSSDDIETGSTFSANGNVRFTSAGKFTSASGSIVGQVVEPLTNGVLRFAKFYKAY